MPFPHHDPAWAAVAEHLVAGVRPGERVVASDLFWVVLPVVHRYSDTWVDPQRQPDWLAVHKGEFARIAPEVLRRALDQQPVTLANDVFVVFGPERARGGASVGDDQVHVKALRVLMEDEGWPDERDEIDDAILPHAGRIERFDHLGLGDLRAAMDEFYRAGGYEYPTRRDRLYDAELDRLLQELIGSPGDRRRLDLASGLGRARRALGPAGAMVVSDISAVALRRCLDAFEDLTGGVVMDAADLAVRSASIDDVTFCDAFEHVIDPEATLCEAARVLRPGGRLFVTANNKDSLNLRLTRALGHTDFVTNYQHITEIAFDDLVAMLDRCGFDVLESRGLFLYPYWGVPGVDEHVREVIDDDAEIVDLSRELGELVGPAHAFVSVVLAERR